MEPGRDPRRLVSEGKTRARGSLLGLSFLICTMQVSGRALTQMKVVLVLGELM